MNHPHPKDLPNVACPYCKAHAALMLDSAALYNGRNNGPVWICMPCGAWVGVHKNSPRYLPLGRLANAELRAAKVRAHEVFDPLWQRKIIKPRQDDKGVKRRARAEGYHWLAQQLGISFEECHIGNFDLETCQRVVDICAPYHPDMQNFPHQPTANQ